MSAARIPRPLVQPGGPALPRGLLGEILRVSSGDEDAARDLAQRWQVVLHEGRERAERIRREVIAAPCSCAIPAEPLVADGRCSRCWGVAS